MPSWWACVLQPPSSWALHHKEPFGPLDSIVIVDTEAEFLAAMNASNGSLVGSIATDDKEFAHRVADELQSFKIGDYVCRQTYDHNDQWIVREALFDATYEILSQPA